jgi:hypothetical protein
MWTPGKGPDAGEPVAAAIFGDARLLAQTGYAAI